MTRFEYATAEPAVETARLLFREYATATGLDACLQNFPDEVARLPGSYAPPRGRLLLAYHDQAPAGCVALRPLDDATAEMKRLYVRPEFRRHGYGRALAGKIIADARALAYRRVCLDTLPSMTAAIHLYESLGFAPTTKYYATAPCGALFFALKLG